MANAYSDGSHGGGYGADPRVMLQNIHPHILRLAQRRMRNNPKMRKFFPMLPPQGQGVHPGTEPFGGPMPPIHPGPQLEGPPAQMPPQPNTPMPGMQGPGGGTPVPPEQPPGQENLPWWQQLGVPHDMTGYPTSGFQGMPAPPGPHQGGAPGLRDIMQRFAQPPQGMAAPTSRAALRVVRRGYNRVQPLRPPLRAQHTGRGHAY